MSAKYKLQRFTDDSFRATRDDWEHKAGKEEFASEYHLVFDWADANRDYDGGGSDSGSSFAYGLFASRSKSACAVIEVVSHKKGKAGLTKLLKIYITPEFWRVEKHQDEIIHIYMSAIVETVELSAKVRARTVKLYGRSDSLLSLLHSLHIRLQEQAEKLPGLVAAMKGRWLEINVPT
ncbi:hypothetical protein [Bordetella hinzii]|uniref:hypothetical protein n=1 Tax=Bordetella hinzii TaxID=103855 RepID=UPI001238D49F|nr:hypothetical protein [Bordetella hinzii]MBZ0073601.1 hypothetical protein [Bordetella hinzii]MBZ0077923.1 hypothetical protein [Bordetella hinzii]MBZ0082398.1 hypothetical protein [Bordetella hinzii]QET42214.1 hypothetical protein FOB29_00605 [Bordetella hinzii]QWF39247.1 hypothetical protein HHA25_13615 [Bordetella hinzii]